MSLPFPIPPHVIGYLRDIFSAANRHVWRKPASFALTIAGASWTLKTGDLFGGLLAASGALVGAGDDEREVSAYSYLFRARSRYSF